LWKGPTGDAVVSSPSVAGGRVFVGSNDGKLYSFDAAGTTNCSGNPRICQPLWTATTPSSVRSSPAVANGVVYISTIVSSTTPARLNAYDAAGNANCSGTPRTCQPLWSSGDLSFVGQSPISVANGVVYVDLAVGIIQFVGTVYALDAAAGSDHCSGTPKTCTPLSSVSPGGTDALGSAPTIANGFVYAAGATLHAYGKP
jgi:outer membrane protein assembly factor BamB